MNRIARIPVALTVTAIAGTALSGCHRTRSLYERLQSGFDSSCYQQILHATQTAAINEFSAQVSIFQLCKVTP